MAILLVLYTLFMAVNNANTKLNVQKEKKLPLIKQKFELGFL